MKSIFVYGAGGHGKVVIDAIKRSAETIQVKAMGTRGVLEELSDTQILGVIDDDVTLHGSTYSGHPVLGGFVELQRYDNKRTYKDYGVIVAIARNDIRKRIYLKVSQLDCDLISVVHLSAQIAKDVTIGPGSMIMATAVLNPGVVLGTGVVINTGAIIEHDCIVHDFVHVGPGSVFAGAVEVGEGSLIGIGAYVLPSIRIGKGVTVAAGAVVIRDIPDGETVVGVPARIIRRKRPNGSPYSEDLS